MNTNENQLYFHDYIYIIYLNLEIEFLCFIKMLSKYFVNLRNLKLLTLIMLFNILLELNIMFHKSCQKNNIL